VQEHPIQNIFTFRLSAPPDEVARARLLLDPVEVGRADRLLRPAYGAAFTLARSALRRVLGAAVGASPASLAFVYGAHGKPALRDAPDLHFNLTHANDVGMIAIAATPVGIDIEALHRDVDVLRLARRCFRPDEQRAWLGCLVDEVEADGGDDGPPQLGAAARALFFRIWTRKEAYMKATGLGFRKAPDRFSVAVRGAPALLADEETPDAPRAWLIRDVAAPDGYVASVVVGRP